MLYESRSLKPRFLSRYTKLIKRALGRWPTFGRPVITVLSAN